MQKEMEHQMDPGVSSGLGTTGEHEFRAFVPEISNLEPKLDYIGPIPTP